MSEVAVGSTTDEVVDQMLQTAVTVVELGGRDGEIELHLSSELGGIAETVLRRACEFGLTCSVKNRDGSLIFVFRH